MTTIANKDLEAIHAAWRAAALCAEAGMPRFTFTRGMKALHRELLTLREERVALGLEHVKRDAAGQPVTVEGDAGKYVLTDPPAFHRASAELEAATVTVDLPPLTDDLLCRTTADADALATLLDFVTPEQTHADR